MQMNRRTVLRRVAGLAALVTTPALAKALKFDVPVMRNPLRVKVSDGTTYLPRKEDISPLRGRQYDTNGAYESELDLEIILPPHPLANSLKVVGGRHVVIIGGAIQPHGSLNSTSLLSFVGPSSSVHVEGLLIDGGRTHSEADGINVSGENPQANSSAHYRPNVTIQCCRIVGIHGTFEGHHSDAWQAYGPIGRLQIDRLTVASSYQGLFLDPAFPQGERHLSRVNTRYQPYDDEDGEVTYQLWMTSGGARSRVPTFLDEVFAEPRSGQTLATQTVWPRVGFDEPDFAAQLRNDGSLGWDPATKIFGEVRPGLPPGGDFVKEDECGLSYPRSTK